MSSDNFQIEGLNELIARFDLKQTEMPKICYEAINKIGNTLKAKTIEKTPLGKSYKNHTGGTLKRSWHIKKIDNYTVCVYNSQNRYATYVEYGHRTRLGASKVEGYKPKPNAKKYAPGTYMLTKSLAEINDLLGKEFEGIIEKIWEK